MGQDSAIYDHLIVGTGQATGTLLGRLIETGDRIGVVEGHEVGGSCVNYGCTPTKTLVASARALHQVRRGAELGFAAESVRLDFGRVRERMNEVRHASRDGLTEWMESAENVDLLRGWARFEPHSAQEPMSAEKGPVHRLRIETADGSPQVVLARRVYLNVGTRPSAPPIEGLDAVPWLDSERLLALEKVPEHLLILGGGYIGLELGQVFRRFGSRVTVFQRGAEVMPTEDADAARVIREALEDEGVRVERKAAVTAVRSVDVDTDDDVDAGVDVEVEIDRGEGARTETVRGSHLLVAAGRRPNSDRLALDQVGVEVDERGFVRVDDVCRTSVEGVFALGDVNGRGAFTHTSVHDAEVVLDHLFGGPRTVSERIPIHALFTDPPLGRVGMTEREARECGRRIGRAVRPMSRISRAKEMGETRGFVKILVDLDRERFLGAQVLGPGGDEVVQIFATAMYADMSPAAFRRMVLIHPTISELLPWTLDEIEELEAGGEAGSRRL